MASPNIHITIRGYLVGLIWWPVGAECFIPFTYDLTREERRISNVRHGGVRLRNHMDSLLAERGGDFQHCTIVDADVTIRLYSRRRPGKVVERTIPLAEFASVADMLHPDPDWCPSCPEDCEA